jgi:hypothetical protein
MMMYGLAKVNPYILFSLYMYAFHMTLTITAITSVNIINVLLCITETQCVSCAIKTEFLDISLGEMQL